MHKLIIDMILYVSRVILVIWNELFYKIEKKLFFCEKIRRNFRQIGVERKYKKKNLFMVQIGSKSNLTRQIYIHIWRSSLSLMDLSQKIKKIYFFALVVKKCVYWAIFFLPPTNIHWDFFLNIEKLTG